MQASLGISPRRKVRKLDEDSSSAANNDGEHDASNDARRGKLTKSARETKPRLVTTLKNGEYVPLRSANNRGLRGLCG